MTTTHLFKRMLQASPEERERQKKALDRHLSEGKRLRRSNETWYRLVTNTNLERADLEKRTLGQVEVTDKNKEAYNLVNAWTPDKSWGVMLWGNVGTGKTHLLKGLMIKWAINEAHILGRFYSLTDLMEEFKSNFDDMQMFKWRLSQVEILVIDDFGAEKTSEFVQSHLLSFIDMRINKGKSIFVTSNYSPEDLKKRYDARILDRLQELMNFCEVKGDSYRRKIFVANRNDAIDSM